MISESSQLLAYAMPALASLAVVCAAWWTAPRRAAPQPGGTAANPIVGLIGRRWIPASLVAVISASLGMLAYLCHAPGLSGDRAIGGAVVALIAVLIVVGYTQCGPGSSSCPLG